MISRRDMLMTGAGAAATGLAGLSPAFAQANDYPNKAIHAICMFPPGAGADVIVRFFAKQLSDQMGKPVVVENKAGAFGNLASEAVARSKPDGTRSISRRARRCFRQPNISSTSCPSIRSTTSNMSHC